MQWGAKMNDEAMYVCARRIFFLHLGEIKPCDDLFLSSKEKLSHGFDDAAEVVPILYCTQGLQLFLPYISTNTLVLTLCLYSTDALAVCNKSRAHMSSL